MHHEYYMDLVLDGAIQSGPKLNIVTGVENLNPKNNKEPNPMLGEVFEFMNSCFPDQKLILKAGSLELGEEEIKAIEARKEKGQTHENYQIEN